MKYVKPLNLFLDIIKRNVPERGRLLGLNVGDKYVGLAVSDLHSKISSPLSVLVREKGNIDLMAGDFKYLISTLDLKGFVVGYPFHRKRLTPDVRRNTLDGEQVKLFLDELSKTGKLEGLEYTFCDGTFTSLPLSFPQYETLAKFDEFQMRHVFDGYATLAKFNALRILQEYLDDMNRKVKLDGCTEKM